MTRDSTLSELFARAESAPYLFVGAGVSRRYLELPDWLGLLRYFCAYTGRDLADYRTEANNSFPEMGTLIAKDFRPVFFDHDDFRELREEFGDDLRYMSSPLKVAIAGYCRDAGVSHELSATLEAEIALLRDLPIDGVVTTNYNTFMETMFPDFAVYVGQDAMLMSQLMGIGEVYKIHGCVSSPNSIVIDSADYRDFNERNAYLAAKLTTTFVEHPVVFLGYSLTDANVRQILSSVSSCLGDSAPEMLRDRLVFVEWEPNSKAMVAESSGISIGTTLLPVTRVRTESYEPIFASIAENPRKFSAPLLRRLKEHVYELVRTTDPVDRMAVVDIEAADVGDLHVVFGVGPVAHDGSQMVGSGYRALSAGEIIAHVLGDGGGLDAERMIDEYFPARRINEWLPIHCFAEQAGRDTDTLDEPARTYAHRAPSEFLPKPASYHSRGRTVREKRMSVSAVLAVPDQSSLHTTVDLLLLRWDQVDPEELRCYLVKNQGFLQESSNVAANFKKLVCLYDRLRWGPGGESGPELPKT